VQLSPLELVLDATAPSIAAWDAVTQRLQTLAPLSFMGHLVTIVIPTPETSWGLLAVDPDVDEQLAVLALRYAGLGPVRFSLYDNVKEIARLLKVKIC
jgi:hypothetical protein